MGKNHILIITTFLIAILVSGAACNPLKKQEKKTEKKLPSALKKTMETLQRQFLNFQKSKFPLKTLILKHIILLIQISCINQ